MEKNELPPFFSTVAIFARFPIGISCPRRSALICCAVAGGPPASTFPALSTAKHEELDGHESPLTTLVPTCATDHADAPPAGLIDPNNFPVVSDAKHKGPDRHHTPAGAFEEMLAYR